MPETVSLVIINFNGLSCIEACLESISQQSHPPDEVLIVDNGSADTSPDQIRTRFPQFRLLALPENTGYAAACNTGIQQSCGELVAILNNDLVLDAHWLRSLLRHKRPEWAFWASRVRIFSAPDLLDSAGDGMSVIGSAYKIGHGRRAAEYHAVSEVFGVSGAAALYRRSMLEEVGGFDPDFFLIYEDADLNMRARLKGFRCLFVPDAVVYHRVNTSIRTFSHTHVYYGHRNSAYVFWQNMPMPLLLLYLPERILFEALAFLYFAGKGRALSFLQSKIDFLKTVDRVIAKRRRIQRSKRISWRQLRSLLERNWTKFRKKAVVIQ